MEGSLCKKSYQEGGQKKKDWHLLSKQEWEGKKKKNPPDHICYNCSSNRTAEYDNADGNFLIRLHFQPIPGHQTG